MSGFQAPGNDISQSCALTPLDGAIENQSRNNVEKRRQLNCSTRYLWKFDPCLVVAAQELLLWKSTKSTLVTTPHFVVTFRAGTLTVTPVFSTKGETIDWLGHLPGESVLHDSVLSRVNVLHTLHLSQGLKAVSSQQVLF